MIKTAEDVLLFWFGPVGRDGRVAPEVVASWFTADESFDEQIRDHFDDTLEQAARGELDGWKATPRGRLALVILFDQFSRNMYRGTPRAFAYDAQALALATEGIAAGADAELRPIERVFMYLPFEHAEDLAAQDRAVALCEALQATVPSGDPDAKLFAGYLDYARRHRDVIAKYGRFPHRNAILGRASTPDEQTYLAQPGAGF
jgi:uncharacterized protein (DUF924 family)